MIKKLSVLLLSTFFLVSGTLLGSAQQKKAASGHGPHVKGKFPPVTPAILNGMVISPADSKAASEKAQENNNDTLMGLAGLKEAAEPVVSATPAGAAPAGAVPPVAAAASNADAKKAAELKKITLLALINRQSSFLNVLPTSLNKKLQGADVVVLGALAGLKRSEEILDCDESDTQAQLSSAVQAIITSNNLQNAEELLKLCESNQIFIDKTQRRSLRKFIANIRQKEEAAFQEEYNKACSELQEKLKKHTERSARHNQLIDGTYQLGGTANLTEQELAYLQGDKKKLTQEQQQALAKKQADRVKAGLSDNEEDHPEYVDPKTIIKVPAASLSALKPGAKSLKATAKK